MREMFIIHIATRIWLKYACFLQNNFEKLLSLFEEKSINWINDLTSNRCVLHFLDS